MKLKIAPSFLVLVVVLTSLMTLGVSCDSEENPGTIEEASGTNEETSGVWTCAMHPEVRSGEPGLCPICNMNLVPVPEGGGGMREPGGEDAQEWVCECCPDVRSSQPGKCPQCNMDLVPNPAEDRIRGRDATPSEGEAEQTREWTCGMHPAIRSQQPGKCPICNMDLVPVEQREEEALRISPESIHLVDVQSEAVRYLPLVNLIRTVGRVEYDERNIRHVASRVSGRIEELYADFVGREVTAGEPLLTVYSPELITTLTEYRKSAGSTADSLGRGGLSSSVFGRLTESARTRLRLWGLSDDDIEEAFRAEPHDAYVFPIRSPISGTVIEKNAFEGRYVREGENLFVVADLSNLWMMADAYEEDIAYLGTGDRVMAQAAASPAEIFHGKVTFVDPYVDENTRTARLRLEINNAAGNLKPGMYMEAHLESPVSGEDKTYWTCPMHGWVVEEGPGECPDCGMFLERIGAGEVLALPKDAVIHSGQEPFVYVERVEGVYEQRQVAVGRLASLKGSEDASYYPVLEGLAMGERVVTNAGFLLHSQARLTGKAASAYGGAIEVESGAHQH